MDRLSGLLLGLWCAVVLAPGGATAETVHLDNGISLTLYTAADLRTDLKGDVGPTDIQTPFGTVSMVVDDMERVPFERDFVVAALRDMDRVAAGAEVSVFILPYRPAGDGSSFSRQNAIFLAPGMDRVDEGTVAYITTHEMGHVLTWTFLDHRAERWDAYLQMRGLDPIANGPAAIHANRAREILAEDIRYLFGGPNATWPGSIENHDLELPDRVSGLRDLLLGYFADPGPAMPLVSSSAFPNPCNPLTNIVMKLPAGTTGEGAEAVLRVFDIRGALVRTVNGGSLAGGRLSVPWNGMTASGTIAASGQYFYVLDFGHHRARGTVTLVR